MLDILEIAKTGPGSKLLDYLSIYLPIRLNPRRGHQTGSGEPSAGVIYLLFFC